MSVALGSVVSKVYEVFVRWLELEPDDLVNLPPQLSEVSRHLGPVATMRLLREICEQFGNWLLIRQEMERSGKGLAAYTPSE